MIKWKRRERCWKEKVFIVLLFFLEKKILPFFFLQQFVFLLLFDIRFYCNFTFFYNSPLLPNEATAHATRFYLSLHIMEVGLFTRICYFCCYTIYLMSCVACLEYQKHPRHFMACQSGNWNEKEIMHDKNSVAQVWRWRKKRREKSF